MYHAPPRTPPLDPAAALLDAVVRSSTLLLGSDDFDAAVTEALGTVARAGGMQRAMLVRHVDADGRPGRERWETAYEWHDPSVAPQGTSAHASGPIARSPSWSGRLLGGEPVLDARTAEISDPALRAAQEALGTRYLVSASIFVDGASWGALSLDDCRTDRRRDEGEKAAIAAAAQAFGLAVHRHRARGEAARLERALQEERRAAAEARAEELARANEALRRGVERLVEARSIDVICDIFVLEAIRASGASAGAVLRRVEGTEFRFATIAQGEQVVREAAAIHFVASHAEVSRSDPAGFFARLVAGEDILLPVDELAEWYPLAGAYHQAQGNAAIWNIPFSAGGEVAGYLGLAFAEHTAPDPVVLETLRALGSQASMALETARLAVEAREAAIARERDAAAEERLALLARSHDAMRRSVDRLATEGHIDALLEGILLEAMRVAGAAGGGITLWRGDRFHAHACVAQDGAIVPREVWEREAMFHEAAEVLNSDQGAFASSLKGEPFTLTRVDQADDWWPAVGAYHRPRGHVEVWNVPCVRGGELLAHLGLAFREPRGEDPMLLGTLASLAQQVTLALELTRLADQVREAAVAREREAAAERRAAEFEETAGLLARSMQRRAASASPDAFVEQLHRELRDLLGGEATAQFRLVWEGQRICGGLVVDGGGTPLPGEALQLRVGEVPAWRHGLREDHILVLRLEADVEQINRSTVDFMRARGFTWLVNLPLFVDGRPAWVVAVAGRNEARLTERNLELFRLLSRQLTLALELRQLAEEARDVAVAREREAAAEERAAQLTRASDALARTAHRLAAEPDLDAFLRQTLVEIATQLRSTTAVVTPYDPDTEMMRLAALVVDGQEVPIDSMTPAIPRGEARFLSHIMASEAYRVFDVDRDRELFWPGAAEFLSGHGMRTSLVIPIRLGDLFLGQVSVAYAELPEFSVEQTTLVRALSNQAALAIQLSRLAQAGRDAAVAREREEAAHARAEELAGANEALRLRDRLLTTVASATRHLLGSEDFPTAVGEALRQLGEAAGISRVKVLLQRPSSTGSGTAHVLEHEWWAPGLRSQASMGVTEFENARIAGMVETLRSGDSFWHLIEDVPTTVRGDFARVGVCSVGAVPIFGKGEYLGLVAFDDCVAHRRWAAAEIDALTVAAQGIGAAMHRHAMEEVARARAAELARANEALREREVLLAAAAQASRALLESNDLGAAMPVALEQVGRAAGWSRTQLLLSGTDAAGRPGHRVHAEWVGEGVEEQLGHTTHEFIADDDVQPLAAQVRGGTPFWVSLDEMTPASRAVFAPLGIVTTVAVPVFVDGGYVGVVGFDDCVRERPRTDHEMDALQTASRVIGAAFQRDRLVDTVARERERAAEERAAELARANEALQRTVGRLSDVAEVRDFYVVALAEMSTAISAGSAGLMLFDADRGTFRMACYVSDGVEQPLKDGPHNREWSLDDPQIARAWEAIQRADPLLVAEIDGPYVHPETRAWHRERRDAAAVYLPLFRGPKPLGFVAFAVRVAEEATRVGGELASALGQQLALALELERLAREARTAAVARERRQAAEERAAELARANAALRTSLDALAAAPDAEIFLAQVLQVAAEQFSAGAAVLWSHGPGRRVAPRLVFADGRGFTAEEFAARHPDCPSFRPFVAAALEVDGEDLLARRRHFVIPDIVAHPAFREAAGEGGVRWYLERGARQELNVPLRLGSETVGALAVYLPAGPPPTAEQVELAYALAAQATLALELTRLADTARDAAVARERERAAEERAAELARANAALSSGLDRLAGERDPAALLRHSLAAATEALGARGAAFFRFDPRHNRLAMDLAVNPALPTVLTPQDAGPFVADADATPYWRTLVEGRRPVVLDARDAGHAHLFWPGTRQWHLDHDQPVSVGVPLVVGDEPLGFVGFTLDDGVAVTAERLGLVQALAHQAALALHLTRLSEETRDAAVARERERAAEERATELARANDALRRSVAAVATLRDVDAFLVEVLRNATEVAGAATGAVVLGTADDTSLQMHSFVRDGRALDPANDPRLAPWRAPRPLKQPVAELLRRLLGEGIGWADADDPTISEEIRAWHRGLGHARIAHIPLFRGSEAIGFIALSFTADAHPRPERVEMVRVLAQQAALALELARLGGEAEQAAVAEERNRIAREIHDTLARGFSGIIWTLEGVKQGVVGGPGEVAARVDTALELARDSLAQARQSLWALRPGTLPRADLERELRRLAGAADGGDTRVELVVAEPVGALGSEAQVNLLRIAEEALNNALRHAAARSVRIELARDGATITLRVADDGKGFGAEAFAPGESFGLRGMRERAQRAGGQLEIDSEAGRGTVVTARVPVGAP